MALALLPAACARSERSQERIVSALFDELGWPSAGSFVEFGYISERSGNTDVFRNERNWTGVLFDGRPRSTVSEATRAILHQAFISSESVVELFRRHGVRRDVSYVSIDLDSADLWVLRALLFSEFRPRVVGVEYNSNYPPGYTIAFPNPPWEPPSHERSARWGGGCYFGSGAAAIELVALEAG